jgi:hypothetical protein
MYYIAKPGKFNKRSLMLVFALMIYIWVLSTLNSKSIRTLTNQVLLFGNGIINQYFTP